jgi:hypothetical protein
MTYPVTKVSCEERTDSGSGPAVDKENEGELEPVPLGDENRVVLGQDEGEVAYGEIVLRPILVHHQTIGSQRVPDPLATW